MKKRKLSGKGVNHKLPNHDSPCLQEVSKVAVKKIKINNKHMNWLLVRLHRDCNRGVEKQGPFFAPKKWASVKVGPLLREKGRTNE